MSAKILFEYRDICETVIHKYYNDNIHESVFPDSMQWADITRAHTKDDKTNKQNFRPLSILPSLSKFFEKFMYEDISLCVNAFLSPYMCGFRKGYSTQHSLIIMLQQWKRALDKNNVAGAILLDLSNAFDSLDRDLLIAKLDAYGFSHSALKLLSSYLSERKQKTKVNNYFSNWSDIIFGLPQGSIFGPLLFNIYLHDIFSFIKEDNVTNYTDDTTPHNINKNINDLHVDCSIL